MAKCEYTTINILYNPNGKLIYAPKIVPIPVPVLEPEIVSTTVRELEPTHEIVPNSKNIDNYETPINITKNDNNFKTVYKYSDSKNEKLISKKLSYNDSADKVQINKLLKMRKNLDII
jgi:hypothetical protein